MKRILAVAMGVVLLAGGPLAHARSAPKVTASPAELAAAHRLGRQVQGLFTKVRARYGEAGDQNISKLMPIFSKLVGPELQAVKKGGKTIYGGLFAQRVGTFDAANGKPVVTTATSDSVAGFFYLPVAVNPANGQAYLGFDDAKGKPHLFGPVKPHANATLGTPSSAAEAAQLGNAVYLGTRGQ